MQLNDQHIVSKTDKDGIIIYVNDEFTGLTGYSKLDLIGSSYDIIKHPDMPQVLFSKLWESLEKNEEYIFIVKNKHKDGSEFWVLNSVKINKADDDLVDFNTRELPEEAVQKIKLLYQDVKEVENARGEQSAGLYLDSYLREEIGKTYKEYVKDLIAEAIEIEKEQNKKKKMENRLNWFLFSDYQE